MKKITSSELQAALLLHIYGEGGEIESSRVYSALGRTLGLSSQDMTASLDEVQGHGGSSSKWENMVRWARNSLADIGYLQRPGNGLPRGVWKLTQHGLLTAEASRSLVPLRIHDVYPDEVPHAFPEGAKQTIQVNSYERNPKARQACLAHYGYRCVVCDLNFEERFGTRGQEFIHVHHVVPLSSIGQMYAVNPIEDLRPVCPNCHAMLHRTEPPCSIDELVAMLALTASTL